MRLANHRGRPVLQTRAGYVDVERASNGLFAADPHALYPRWSEFRTWAAAYVEHGNRDDEVERFDPAAFGSPSPAPTQVFAIGLNYAEHSAEVDVAPGPLSVFTKFRSSLTGPHNDIGLPSDQIDWEAELVVVIATEASRVAVADAWTVVAGVTVGQDLSDRGLQFQGDLPQFSLGKSFSGFAPVGPFLVTPDELPDRDDLEISCTLNGEIVQHGRTSAMIRPVPVLVSELSHVVTLYPGDLILTGTPAGVGHARTPPRYLASGDVLTTRIEGVGEMRQHVLGPCSSGAAQSVGRAGGRVTI